MTERPLLEACDVGPRFLIYWMFRRDSLCSGEANCADAVKIRDEAGELVDRDRCSTCPLTGLEAAMTSSVGRTIQRVADIDAQLQ